MIFSLLMRYYLVVVLVCWFALASKGQSDRRVNFNGNWKFFLGDDSLAKNPAYNDSKWRMLSLPHDWSIEGRFSDKNSTTQAEGGLPAGIGWYRKTFIVPASAKNKLTYIDFDGVYRNSEVWINGHYLGKRPNGYISFEYDLTPYLLYGAENAIAVKVDNSAQPNSRWYSGSGIYRNVWLKTVNKGHFANWATFITTPKVTRDLAVLSINTKFVSAKAGMKFKFDIYDAEGKLKAHDLSTLANQDDPATMFNGLSILIRRPVLWSPDRPYLYKVVMKLMAGDRVLDEETHLVGLRTFDFDAARGFFLNGQSLKIKGVCLHHDEGALGAAVNVRAMERQLQILKAMGCNAIRTSHNPPAPEFLDLCDRMGFLVMDEAFDMWHKKKSKHDYSEDWDKWHTVDLRDQILRDRNHPSVFMWSIGNEIREQFDSTGVSIARELVQTVKALDNTRPVTSALSESGPKKNFIYQSGALDVVGLNYHQEVYADFPKNYPGQKFIATETMSALETRGFYDQPTDTTRHWPHNGKEKFVKGNSEMAVTAYDNVVAYWGSTHEETWKIIKKYPFLSGLFVWTGFDYIGEPTPYPWPARSSYFGIVDLAGFPKDVYYMYQSEWTDKPVLHLLPHWNWKKGDTVSVWAYYNQADEVELYLNGRSLGKRAKQGDDLHVSWNVPFEPGVLKAVSRKNGKIVLTKTIRTAGAPAKIELLADRAAIHADGKDLSYITIKVTDQDGNVVPDADNLVSIDIKGAAKLAGMDNGSETDLQSFGDSNRRVFHGLAVAIVRAGSGAGAVSIKATAEGLQPASIVLTSK